MFGLFNRVSMEFAGTCCAHRKACFSTVVPLAEERGGGEDGAGTTFLFFFFNVCKRWTRLRSSRLHLLSCCRENIQEVIG